MTKRINLEDIRKLREATSAGVADCRQALDECQGNLSKAREWLRRKGMERAEKKVEREVKAGAVFAYVHHTGRLGSMVGLACETDFVAKTEDFGRLGKELALQAASTRATSVEELLEQEYVRDPAKKVSELIKEVIGKLGENIRVMDVKVTVV